MSFHIIGDQDTVLGFRFAGVTGTVVSSLEDASQAFRQAVTGERCRILLLTERVERMIRAEATAHRLAAVPPYLVVIEDMAGPDAERRTLQELIAEAVGVRMVRDA